VTLTLKIGHEPQDNVQQDKPSGFVGSFSTFAT